MPFSDNGELRAINKVLGDITRERLKQLEKWGVQSHPDLVLLDDEGGDSTPDELRQHFAETADELKEANGETAADWTSILLEEVYEALAEPEGSEALEKELVQCAAVCVAWVEDLRQRRAAT